MYNEFNNLAKYSKYPFSDSCSLIDDVGNTLASGFLLDVSLCLWSDEVPYLSSLSKGVGTFSVKNKPFAEFSYTGPGSFGIKDTKTGREIGVAVLGPSASGIEEAVFHAKATQLSPACFCSFPPKKPIISLAADSDQRLSGNIRITGRNGVYVTRCRDKLDPSSYCLRIDVIGPSGLSVNSCCDVLIRDIFVINDPCALVSGAPFTISTNENNPFADVRIIPGALGLHSTININAVCGTTYRAVEEIDGVDSLYDVSCQKPDDPAPADPCDSGNGYSNFMASFIRLAAGELDLIPAIPAPSPLYVDVKKASASSHISSASDDDMITAKDLVELENSGIVVFGFKGSVQ